MALLLLLLLYNTSIVCVVLLPPVSAKLQLAFLWKHINNTSFVFRSPNSMKTISRYHGIFILSRMCIVSNKGLSIVGQRQRDKKFMCIKDGNGHGQRRTSVVVRKRFSILDFVESPSRPKKQISKSRISTPPMKTPILKPTQARKQQSYCKNR